MSEPRPVPTAGLLLFGLLLILLLPVPDVRAARELGVVTVENDSLSQDKNAVRRIFALLDTAQKNHNGKILEIEGGVYDPDPATRVERSFRLAREVYMLIEGSRKRYGFDIYISAARLEQPGGKGGGGRVRLVIHDERFDKVGVGRVETLPPSSRPSPGAPATPPPPPSSRVSVGVDQHSPPPQYIPPGYAPQLSPEEIREIDERMTRDQSRRAQELIERAKSKAAERQRRRALEEKREAEQLQQKRREAERSPSEDGTVRER